MAIIKCPACGKEFPDSLQACPNCGHNPFVPNEPSSPQYAPQQFAAQIKKSDNKNKVVAGILCLFLWGFGAHEFYLGSVKKGVACIFINILIAIISAFAPILGVFLVLVPIIFAIKLFIMPQEKFDSKYNSPTSPRSKMGCLIAIVVFAFLVPLMFGILAAIFLPQYLKSVEQAKGNTAVTTDVKTKTGKTENAGPVAVYLNAVEKSRAAEMRSLLLTISASQLRHYLQTDKFANDVNELDVDLLDENKNVVNSGSSFTTTYFTVNLKDEGMESYVEAVRRNTDKPYTIRKYYKSGDIKCESATSLCESLGLSAE